MSANTVRSIVIHSAGDLRVDEVPADTQAPDELTIRIATGGVCGSDLHYYNHGGFGQIRLKEPMILGHEVAGHVLTVGDEVQDFEPGDLVAVSPSRPCGQCLYCQSGQHNHCLNMRFYGSAMPFPHVQGAFREVLVANARQCVVANGLDSGEAAMAEPFAVVLHATRRAGSLLGKRVLITGCGPIGVLAVIAARRAGAAEIVVTDLADNALAHASAAGADRAINTGNDAEALQEYTINKGSFDVLYECSGAEVALRAAVDTLRPGGIIMQLGLSGDMSLPMMTITAKELELRGSFRFHAEFETAVRLMQAGLVDLKPLITHTVELTHAETAFQMANDRSQAMKTQISFNGSTSA